MKNQELKTKTAKGLIWKFGERFAAQLVSFVVGIILARLLVPADYAIVGMTTIVFTFCNIFISNGLTTALVQRKSEEQKDFSSVFVFSIIIASLLYVIVFFSAPFISKIYRLPELKVMLRVMGITIFINSIKALPTAKLTIALEFRKFFFATFVGTILSAIVGISMAYWGYGPWALIAQQMTNATIDTIILLIVSKYSFGFFVSVDRLKPLVKYSWKLLLSSFVGVLFNEIRPLVIGLRFKTEDLAYYNKGRAYPQIITTSIEGSIDAVILSAMAHVNDNPNAVLGFLRKFIRISSFIVFPALLGFAAVAESFVVVVLTQKWLPVVPYIYIFCVSSMLSVIQQGNIQAIKAIGRSDYILIMEVVRDVFFVGILLLFILFSSSPVVFAFSTFVCSVIGVIVRTFPSRVLFGYRYRDQLADILPNFLSSIIMSIVVFSLKFIISNVYILFPLQVVFGAFFYLSINFLIKNESLLYCINSVKSHFKR